MYIVGYPRSGNTWLCYLLAYSLNAEYDDWDDPGVHPRNESQRRHVKGGLPHTSFQAQLGRVLKTHALRLDVDEHQPIVYLVRDGRDVMVSYYFYTQASGQQVASSTHWRAVVQRALRRTGLHSLAGKMNISTLSGFVHAHSADWARHVRTWTARKPDAVVRYEDLRADPLATLSKLMEQIGARVSPDVLGQAIEKFSFERLSGRSPGQEDSDRFFRKGVTGDWKNHLSDKDAQHFLQVAGDILVELGYDLN